MSDCLFCKIVAGQIPATKVFEDDQVIAFEDIQPRAPFHILVVPKKHISSVNEAEPEDAPLLGHLVLTATRIAREKGVSEAGHRLVFNSNKDAGQTVFHIHLHLLAGRQLTLMG